MKTYGGSAKCFEREERNDLPDKAQLTKYYEMDGALRAYANRMAVLGIC